MNNMVEIAGLVLFLIGLYGLAARRNIIKSIIALGIMDIGIILFFLGIRYVPGAAAPMTAADDAAAAWAYAQTSSASAGEVAAQSGGEAVWADAVPQALMITAIVIGVAVTAVALMMFIALYHRYGTTNWKTAHNIRKEERRN